MDLDLAHVRAFVTAADRLHFGRAAKDLSLSQQALSARISRLEGGLGVKLFVRGARGVRLTTAGRHFLDPARRLLLAGDQAVASTRSGAGPLRMNVWGSLLFPSPTIRALAGGESGPRLEVGVCRDLPDAVAALHDDTIDVALGRVSHGADTASLARRLIRLDAMAVIVNIEHPLAGHARLTPRDLRGTPLWLPAPLESLDFLRQFVERFGLEGRFGGVDLGPYHIPWLLREEPHQAAVVPAHLESFGEPFLRLIPLVDPTPLYGSSLLWSPSQRHPEFDALLRRVDTAIRQRAWLRYDKHRHWLPQTEQADVEALAL
ncbi:LysR family transcriptional regulator [Actinomadura sp. NPDC047616]|uniref:LysR family transcriptional regulator n=1 Tax=Actinomadura sp. NPDC047616 TaxID=3155914 RepID=UPI0033ED976E